MSGYKTFIKADGGRLSSVVEYEIGARIEVPINKDGTVKWYKDKPKNQPKSTEERR